MISNPALQGAVAYASGLNIFLTNIFLKESPIYKVEKKDAIFTLFHEWVHVVQHYEVLQSFSEEYLSIPGNYLVTFGISTFNKDYAKIAGWEFMDDQYADSSYAKLGTDSESQKTTDYGKTKYVEDMADTAASFLLCDTAKFSSRRIDWLEKTVGTPASAFCPSKI